MSRKTNSFFQFKEFRIDQSRSAMKVTTEASILGAYVSACAGESTNILDIGSGTGILSLMLAQNSKDAKIDAIEIDESSVDQSNINFENSPWGNRLTCFHVRAQDFEPQKRYDLIISNPPFFNKSFKSPDEKVNLARHNDSLSSRALLVSIIRLLHQKGRAFVLFPPEIGELSLKLAQELGLKELSRLEIFTKEDEVRQFRWILEFGLKHGASNIEKFSIRTVSGEYTPEFTQLLKPYYLYL